MRTRKPTFSPPSNPGDPMDMEDWSIKDEDAYYWRLTSTEEHIDGIPPRLRPYRGLPSIHGNPEASRLRRAKHFYTALLLREADFAMSPEAFFAALEQEIALVTALRTQLGIGI